MERRIGKWRNMAEEVFISPRKADSDVEEVRTRAHRDHTKGRTEAYISALRLCAIGESWTRRPYTAPTPPLHQPPRTPTHTQHTGAP
eukprot:966331-Prymnesium_polylepis.1